MPTFEAKHGIGDRVYVPDLEVFAAVKGVCFRQRGTEYEIAYFHDGKQQHADVFADQLKPAHESGKPDPCFR